MLCRRSLAHLFFRPVPCRLPAIARREGVRRATSLNQPTLRSGSMDAIALGIANDYMQWSSEHDLDKVFSLFASDASYTSEALRGTWTGLQDIQGMMRPFFNKFPDVTWEVTRMFVTSQLGGAPSDDDDAQPSPSSRPPPGGALPSSLECREGVVHVEVHFIRRWTEGTEQESRGREWICVDPQHQRILHVHVAKLGSMWDFW